jgi:hypothetical protein
LPTRRNNSVLFLSRVMISHWTEAFEAFDLLTLCSSHSSNWLWFFLNHCFSLWIVVLSYKVKHRFNTHIFFAGPIHFISFQCKLMESHSVLYFTHKHFAACKMTWLLYKYILFCWQAANVSFLLRSLIARNVSNQTFFENFVFSNGVTVSLWRVMWNQQLHEGGWNRLLMPQHTWIWMHLTYVNMAS